MRLWIRFLVKQLFLQREIHRHVLANTVKITMLCKSKRWYQSFDIWVSKNSCSIISRDMYTCQSLSKARLSTGMSDAKEKALVFSCVLARSPTVKVIRMSSYPTSPFQAFPFSCPHTLLQHQNRRRAVSISTNLGLRIEDKYTYIFLTVTKFFALYTVSGTLLDKFPP